MFGKGELRLNFSANGCTGTRTYISIDGLGHSLIHDVLAGAGVRPEDVKGVGGLTQEDRKAFLEAVGKSSEVCGKRKGEEAQPTKATKKAKGKKDE